MSHYYYYYYYQLDSLQKKNSSELWISRFHWKGSLKISYAQGRQFCLDYVWCINWGARRLAIGCREILDVQNCGKILYFVSKLDTPPTNTVVEAPFKFQYHCCASGPLLAKPWFQILTSVVMALRTTESGSIVVDFPTAEAPNHAIGKNGVEANEQFHLH